jgi:hypothetical protein
MFLYTLYVRVCYTNGCLYSNVTLVYVLLGISPPGKYPKEHIHYSKHGESLKSRMLLLVMGMMNARNM